MERLVLRNSSRVGVRSLAVVLLFLATVGVVALLSFGTVSPALAATGDDGGSLAAGSLSAQATKATKASAFDYKVGRYIAAGKVYKSKCWYGTKTIKGVETTHTKGKYGPEFTMRMVGGSGGAAWSGGGHGFNCGYGVYITGYKGSASADVVVPNTIGGKPVVCICLEGATMNSLDVSRCKNLKALSLGFQPAAGSECTIGEIKFGKNPKLAHFSLDRSTVTEKLNITPKNLRKLSLMFSNPKNGFSFDAPKLNYFGCYGITGLHVSGSKYLKELFVNACTGCNLELGKMPNLEGLYMDSCGLTKLNVSKNTKLVNLAASGNSITKLNLSKNKKLASLNVSRTNLTKLDVSKNAKLKTITAYSNKFSKKTLKALQKWEKAKKGRKLSL